MTNVVVLCHERFKLTRQCIDSIRVASNPREYTLTIVDDGTKDFRMIDFLDDQAKFNPNTSLLRVTNSNHCLGALKNLGVMYSGQNFGRGNWLCVLDNDVNVFPGWLDKLAIDGHPAILGGCRHPYHGVNSAHDSWDETYEVAGYCHHMSWSAWDELGPYKTSGGGGVMKGEDSAICNTARLYGMSVGYINPPVLTHCGVTNSEGKPAIGSELFERIPWVLYA